MVGMKITHYDLFAGIGGFSYALDTIFNNHEIKHIFCEWKAFPTAVLKKHWPDGTYYGDIADLVADTNGQRDSDGSGKIQEEDGEVPERDNDAELSNSNRSNDITILTGGFPCQPFSHAGRRQGTADDRYKWPDMFAVIRNVRPDWVIAENVRGLVTWNDGMVLETVCADLESEGYEVQPLVIPACAIGAPHRRDRVWIIAHAINDRQGRTEQGSNGAPDSVPKEYRAEHGATREPQRADSDRLSNGHASDTRQQLWEQRGGEGVEADTTIRATRSEANQREYQHTWADDWREVAFATCYDGVDDGLPRRMDGTTISASRHRTERLKACGNAIVPQVAMEIFRAIKACA
jgi:DNA (cytosine-5)-methyltransferase 1